MFKSPPHPITSHGEHNYPKGISLLGAPLLNKGTAFSERERDLLGLRGLLPPRILSMDTHVARIMKNYRRQSSDLDKYIYLTNLQNRNEVLFYRVVMEHIEEMLPIIYTPTVGQACTEFASIFSRPRGLYISLNDRGRIAELLLNWPHQKASLICVTDGQRILGLGDLGATGMGIPIGKLSLYTACAGVHPYYCLPIVLDVGTDNERLLTDPLYIGLQRPRAKGEEYEAFLDEFIAATQEIFPGCLVQFEDFGNANAFHLLHKWRDKICTFNDDIQGTASVAVAGLISALCISGGSLADQRLLFFGAGEAGTGIGELWVSLLKEQGIPEAEARRRCWFVESKGLVVKSRWDELNDHKRHFAHEHEQVKTFGEAVNILKPTAIIGVAGTGRAFTQEILEDMAAINERPIVFALSNPTSKSECTAEEAYNHTDGRAIFASGSPFPPVVYKGKTFVPGQGNNVYIFPGIGMGALASCATRVTDSMFLAAAKTLASLVSEEDLAMGRIFPALTRVREVSGSIAEAVAKQVWDQGLTEIARPADIAADIQKRMFQPDYPDFFA